MNILPFLILGLGGAFAFMVWACRDNTVVRKPSPLRRAVVSMRASIAPFLAAMTGMAEAAKHAAAFQKVLVEVQTALALSVEEAGESLRAAMRPIYVETPEDAKRRLLREWASEFRKPPAHGIVKGLD